MPRPASRAAGDADPVRGAARPDRDDRTGGRSRRARNRPSSAGSRRSRCASPRPDPPRASGRRLHEVYTSATARQMAFRKKSGAIAARPPAREPATAAPAREPAGPMHAPATCAGPPPAEPAFALPGQAKGQAICTASTHAACRKMRRAAPAGGGDTGGDSHSARRILLPAGRGAGYRRTRLVARARPAAGKHIRRPGKRPTPGNRGKEGDGDLVRGL